MSRVRQELSHARNIYLFQLPADLDLWSAAGRKDQVADLFGNLQHRGDDGAGGHFGCTRRYRSGSRICTLSLGRVRNNVRNHGNLLGETPAQKKVNAGSCNAILGDSASGSWIEF